MIGVIRRPNWKKPPTPDDFFDPTTHIATEENFIKFLQAGIYTSDVIGYKVQLTNSVDYNNGLWVIADVNHDSSQLNTYDIISEDCFNQTIFASGRPDYRSSYIRDWLTNTFCDGFSSDFKIHLNNIRYDSDGNSYNDDKIIIPSYTECNGSVDYYAVEEGTAYPIFTDNTSRQKNIFNASGGSWWTRTRYNAYYYNNAWCVQPLGALYSTNSSRYMYYVAPVLRVS